MIWLLIITLPCAGYTHIWNLNWVNTVPADVLAPISFRPAADTMLTTKINIMWLLIITTSSAGYTHIDGILPKRPYLPCLRMTYRAFLAEYPRCMGSELGQLCAWRCHSTYRCNMLGHQQAQCSLKHVSFLVYLALNDSFLFNKPDHWKHIWNMLSVIRLIKQKGCKDL